MSAPREPARRSRALELSGVRAALWLSITAFRALRVLYFVGLDQVPAR